MPVLTNAPAVALTSQSAFSASGVAQGVRIPIRKAATVTNIVMRLNVIGSGLTSGQCFAALYQGGNLLAVTADQSAVWAGSTGVKTMALSSPQAVAAGFVDVLFWAVGTTMPQFLRGNSNGDIVNAGLAASALRAFTANTGLTTTAPASIGTRNNGIHWFVELT